MPKAKSLYLQDHEDDVKKRLRITVSEGVFYLCRPYEKRSGSTFGSYRFELSLDWLGPGGRSEDLSGGPVEPDPRLGVQDRAGIF